MEPRRSGLSGAKPAEGIRDRSALPHALAFAGAVDCVQDGGGRWRLRGRLRAEEGEARHAAVELLLTGVRAPAPAQSLPSRLHELRIQMSEGTEHTLELAAREGSFMLQIDTARLHHEAAEAFYRAVPVIAPPRSTRLGWAVLLTLLRLPLVARCVRRAGKMERNE